MPNTTNAPDTLSGHAKQIWLAAFNSAYEGTCKDRSNKDECAARIAWGAVKEKYHKKGESWIANKADLIEVSMVITKASLQPDGSMRWQAVTSDTSPDNTGEATSLALFQDWIERAATGQGTDWLPAPRKPFLGVSHYSDLDGYGEAGITKEMWIQGDRFKAGGTFRPETPIGPALFEAVKSETELIRRGESVNQPIRISAAWWDISHSHGPFIFERKSLTDVCPMCARGEGSKVYLKGQLDHFAATRVPINPRTSLALQEKSDMGTTRKQDAATIIDEDLAEELESKSKLVGKSETEIPLVTKAKKQHPDEETPEEDAAEEPGDETMEEEHAKMHGKKAKGAKGGSFMDKSFTWEGIKALPEAKGLSRLDLIGLVRRNIAQQPEAERLGLFEALLDDMAAEVEEIKTAVEDLYFLQPAVEEDLLLEADDPPERNTEMDYLDTFNQAVTEALESDQPAAKKAEVLQKALTDVTMALKAELETPAQAGDMVAAFKAAIAPLSDQLAQLNARLGATQQPVVMMPTQRSITTPTVIDPQPQNQLPISPITGQPSSLTGQIRRSVGL